MVDGVQDRDPHTPSEYAPRQLTTSPDVVLWRPLGVRNSMILQDAFSQLDQAPNPAGNPNQQNNFGFTPSHVQELKGFMLYNAIHDDRLTVDRALLENNELGVFDDEFHLAQESAKTYWSFGERGQVSLMYNNAPNKYLEPVTLNNLGQELTLPSGVVPNTAVTYDPDLPNGMGPRGEKNFGTSITPKAEPDDDRSYYPGAPLFYSPHENSNYFTDRWGQLTMGKSRATVTDIEQIYPHETRIEPF